MGFFVSSIENLCYAQSMTWTPRNDGATDHYVVMSADHADWTEVYISNEVGDTFLLLADEGIPENDTTWTTR